MRVLVLWNTAGCLTPVIKHLERTDNEVKVLIREGYDAARKTTDLGCVEFAYSAIDLYLKSMLLIRRFNPDIIHLNSRIEVLKYIRLATIRTPVVLMYHGSEIRDKKPSRWQRLANVVLVSTPDLVEYGRHIGRPVSPIFSYKGGRVPDTALMFYRNHFPKDQRSAAREWAAYSNVNLTIQEDVVPHSEMPELLSRFETLLDFKGIDGALSLTALEAIQCGCKVVHDGNAPYESPVSPESYLSFYAELLS